MPIFKKKGLTTAIVVYWVLLLYIIAALIWWFIALQQQNHQMTTYKLMELNMGDPRYLAKISAIDNQEKRKTTQYLGEGSIFLLLILVGAVFVYRAVRKQWRINLQQQNFMMAVTHELKTPIAIAKLNLETVQKHKLTQSQQQNLIQTTLEEIERLNNLASNILVSSELEGGNYTLYKEQLNLSSIAITSIQHYQQRFADRKISCHIAEDVLLFGDHLLLQMLINNLLDNALKYTHAPAAIHFSLKRLPNAIALQVADEGPGIPDAEKKRIFERFYRMGDEQVRKTKGTGLGLYLCKKIASDHKGRIAVTNHSPQGSIFSVLFSI
jgi:two-component system, OmpR family, sensor histidine kinase CiaH